MLVGVMAPDNESVTIAELRLQTEYRSDYSDLVPDFYVPYLERSTLYRRAVGYFTSRGLSAAAQGISAFMTGDGRMLLVASPLLSGDDLEVSLRGYKSPSSVDTLMSIGVHPASGPSRPRTSILLVNWSELANNKEFVNGSRKLFDR